LFRVNPTKFLLERDRPVSKSFSGSGDLNMREDPKIIKEEPALENPGKEGWGECALSTFLEKGKKNKFSDFIGDFWHPIFWERQKGHNFLRGLRTFEGCPTVQPARSGFFFFFCEPPKN
jgi:hypothetical protein